MFNQFVINGRLTKDVEVRTNKNGKKFAFLTVACDRNYKAQDGSTPTDFISVMVSGDKQADFVEKYFHKGDGILVDGSITVVARGEGDQKRSEILLVANRCHFVAGGRGKASTDAKNTSAAPATAASDVEVLDDDDDLPF